MIVFVFLFFSEGGSKRLKVATSDMTGKLGFSLFFCWI